MEIFVDQFMVKFGRFLLKDAMGCRSSGMDRHVYNEMLTKKHPEIDPQVIIYVGGYIWTEAAYKQGASISGGRHWVFSDDMTEIRYFQGSETGQLDAYGCPADPFAWYYEPVDYIGDVLWSEGYPTRVDAIEAADHA